MAPQQSGPTGGSAYAPFKPRLGTWVARVCALACVAAFTFLALTTPGTGEVSWSVPDRVMTIVFGGVLAAFLLRFAALRAVPTKKGLRVVNLVRSTNLEWASIVNVGFSGGSPWVVLELNDTEEIAVMAIQRADGAFAALEASRLAALVAHHSTSTGRACD